MVDDFNMRVDSVFTTLALMFMFLPIDGSNFLSGNDSNLIMSSCKLLINRQKIGFGCSIDPIKMKEIIQLQ